MTKSVNNRLSDIFCRFKITCFLFAKNINVVTKRQLPQTWQSYISIWFNVRKSTKWRGYWHGWHLLTGRKCLYNKTMFVLITSATTKPEALVMLLTSHHAIKYVIRPSCRGPPVIVYLLFPPPPQSCFFLQQKWNVCFNQTHDSPKTK